MVDKIQWFKFEDQYDIRTITLKGEAWFLIQDLAKALGFADVIESNSTKGLPYCPEGNNVIINTYKFTILCKGLNLTNELGLYSLITSSHKPVAKRFKQWITSEVLPIIRQTDEYHNTQQNNIETLKEFKRFYASAACFCL
jgi:prophage antirepressor-like protein